MQLSLFSISLFCILVFLSLSKHLIIMKVCTIRKQILVPSHAVWPGLGPRRPRLGGAAAALLVLPLVLLPLVLLPAHLFLLLLAVSVHNVPPSLHVWAQPYTWKYGCMRAHRIKKQTGARLCCQHHVFVIHRCVCSAVCMRTQSLRLARVCQVEGCNSATTSLASECGFGMSWRRF